MIDISKELKFLNRSDGAKVLDDLKRNQTELAIKIYLLNCVYSINQLKEITDKNKLNLSVIFTLEYDNEIGHFFSFKIRNNIGNYIYDNFKLASPNNKSKKDSLIRKIQSIFNNINNSIKIEYINQEIKKNKPYQYKITKQNLELIQKLILSKELFTILEYGTLQNKVLNNNNEITKVSKIWFLKIYIYIYNIRNLTDNLQRIKIIAKALKK